MLVDGWGYGDRMVKQGAGHDFGNHLNGNGHGNGGDNKYGDGYRYGYGDGDGAGNDYEDIGNYEDDLRAFFNPDPDDLRSAVIYAQATQGVTL